MQIYSNVIIYFAVALSVEKWTPIETKTGLPETTLPLVSDMNITTCAHVGLNEGDIILRGELSADYTNLLVTVTMATNTTFGSRPGQHTCHPRPSSLLTHVGSHCNQTFCAVPTRCNYVDKEVISTEPNLWQYDFSCACGQHVCRELLLWLRPDSVHDHFHQVGVCEIIVAWIDLLILTSHFYVHLSNKPLLILIMPCHQLGAKLSSEPMPAYWSFKHCEHILVKL